MKLILVRHGETEWNQIGKKQGNLDSPLTPLGQSQARETANQLAGQKIDAIISSSLGRTIQTAKIIGKILNLPLSHSLPEFRERSFGILNGTTPKERKANFSQFLDENDDIIWNDDSQIPAMERPKDILPRLKSGLQKIKKLFPPDATILLVTHRGIILGLTDHLLDKPIDLQNGNFTEIQI